MAHTPCTIVLFSEDKINLPIDHLMVVLRQLFQYGVKDIIERDDKAYVYLSYCPKGTTLKRKLGTLPVRYMRTKLNNEEEFKILERVVKRYKFNLLDEEEEADPAAIMNKKKKMTIEEVYGSDEGEEEEEDFQQQGPSTSNKK